jgi:hypothetical protein
MLTILTSLLWAYVANIPQRNSANIKDVPGGKFNIVGGHSICHSKQKLCCTCVIFRTVSEIEVFHCTAHSTLYRRATRYILTRDAKCTDTDGGIFENVLY